MHTLPTRSFGIVRVHTFSSTRRGEGIGTLLIVGNPEDHPQPLVRIHSRCLFGDVFEALDCDCRAQYDSAVGQVGTEECGVICYLEQEGRGCGLLNKSLAYEKMEDAGLDTVDAYKALNLPVDARSYRHAGEALVELGLRQIRLLTNNPQKVEQVLSLGIDVRRVPLQVGQNGWNAQYLRTKEVKLGHDLATGRQKGA